MFSSRSAQREDHGLWQVVPTANHSPAHQWQVLGKAEGKAAEWHGHITSFSVAPEYRRLGLASAMIGQLELISDQIYKGFFIDLFVRCTNDVAIGMYEKHGYSVYRRIRGYYGQLGVEQDRKMKKMLLVGIVIVILSTVG